MNKIYYIETSDNEWSSSIKGYYSTLDNAKKDMKNFSNWYRPNGTGQIYELTLDTHESPVLVYEKW